MFYLPDGTIPRSKELHELNEDQTTASSLHLLLSASGRSSFHYWPSFSCFMWRQRSKVIKKQCQFRLYLLHSFGLLSLGFIDHLYYIYFLLYNRAGIFSLAYWSQLNISLIRLGLGVMAKKFVKTQFSSMEPSALFKFHLSHSPWQEQYVTWPQFSFLHQGLKCPTVSKVLCPVSTYCSSFSHLTSLSCHGSLLCPLHSHFPATFPLSRPPPLLLPLPPPPLAQPWPAATARSVCVHCSICPHAFSYL